jgi:hypothetical protein
VEDNDPATPDITELADVNEEELSGIGIPMAPGLRRRPSRSSFSERV